MPPREALGLLSGRLHRVPGPRRDTRCHERLGSRPRQDPWERRSRRAGESGLSPASASRRSADAGISTPSREAAAIDALATWWRESAPEQYKPLGLVATTRCPPELALPRHMLHHLLAARSQHADYADCHERLDHVDAKVLCLCSCGLLRHQVTPFTAASCRSAGGLDWDQYPRWQSTAQ